MVKNGNFSEGLKKVMESRERRERRRENCDNFPKSTSDKPPYYAKALGHLSTLGSKTKVQA